MLILCCLQPSSQYRTTLGQSRLRVVSFPDQQGQRARRQKTEWRISNNEQGISKFEILCSEFDIPFFRPSSVLRVQPISCYSAKRCVARVILPELFTRPRGSRQAVDSTHQFFCRLHSPDVSGLAPCIRLRVSFEAAPAESLGPHEHHQSPIFQLNYACDAGLCPKSACRNHGPHGFQRK